MLEELQFEVSRAASKMFLRLNYDATARYNRIIQNLAMVASQYHGVDKQVTLTNVRTLQHASYHIRTNLGLSESCYSHSEETPIYGTGQGSGNSPMIWCFISSLLYNCYNTQAYPVTYSIPNVPIIYPCQRSGPWTITTGRLICSTTMTPPEFSQQCIPKQNTMPLFGQTYSEQQAGH
jgi:hypothetical protein